MRENRLTKQSHLGFSLTKNHLLILLILLQYGRMPAATFFITPAGAGIQDGSSWANAAPGVNLQLVIDGAAVNDEVWVACGTYYPTTTTDRSISFSMRNGVSILGGFVGNESLLSERNLSCGPCSIVSGEIGGVGNADNSYKVFYNQALDNSAILDGFTIRDGNDDRSPTSAGNGLGGGLYNHGFNPGGFCHPVIRNCVFTNNSASWGGGAFNNGYNNGNTEPTYINCIFSQNHAYIEAGGMDSYGVGGNASPTVMNTVFYANTAATNVGAMYAWGGNAGGNSAPVLINCVFANNQALNGYAGAFIADNMDESGGTSSGSCTVTLQNCIVWNNTSTSGPDQFYIRGTGAQVVATYSDIDLSNQPAPHVISGSGIGNLNLTPSFMNIADADGPDNCWLTADDGLHLQGISPCVDAGDNTGIYATDVLGNARISGLSVDMGLYESQTPLPLEILSFTAQQEDQKVRLEWMGFAENEHLMFVIERSHDGYLFDSLETIHTQSQGALVNTYRFLDQSPLPGLAYYRLKQIDADGKISYSNLASVHFSPETYIYMYPNPVVDDLFVQGPFQEEETFMLFNIAGERVLSSENFVQVDLQTYKLNVQALPIGLYFLKSSKGIYRVIKVR